jgi:hypothetical protein
MLQMSLRGLPSHSRSLLVAGRTVVSDKSQRALIDAAYARLRDSIAGKQVRAEHAKSVAFDSLDRAKAQIEEPDERPVAEIGDEPQAAKIEDPPPGD